MKRPSRDSYLLIGLLLLFVALTYAIAGTIPDSGETAPRRTTFSSRPGGLKAAYLLLERCGIPVDRLYTKPGEWSEQVQVVVTATPVEGFGANEPWDAAEVIAVRRWLEKGGNLLLLQSEPTGLTKALGLKPDIASTAGGDLSPRQPAVFLQRIATVRFREKQRFVQVPPESVSLFFDRNPAMVAFSVGKGQVIALSSPSVFDNTDLRQSGNARLLVQMIDHLREGQRAVYFDEYHQGYTKSESLWTLIGRPGQMAAYQLLLLVVLLLYTNGRRFGLAQPLPPPPRLSSEYVVSLAHLYRRAKATDAALESLYQGFWRDLCRETGLPLDAGREQVAQHAAALFSASADSRQPEQELFRLLTECEEKIASGPKVLNEATMLRLANRIEDMRKELQLAGHD